MVTTGVIIAIVIIVLVLIGLGVGLGLYFGLRNRNNTNLTGNTNPINPFIQPNQQTSPNFGMIQSVVIAPGQNITLQTATGAAAFSYTNYWTFSVKIPDVTYFVNVTAMVGFNNVTGSLNGSTDSITVVNAAQQVYLPNVTNPNVTGSLALFYWSALPSSQIVSISIPVKERTNKAYVSALVDSVNLVTLVPFTVCYLPAS